MRSVATDFQQGTGLTHETVSPEKLKMIEQAEYVLRDLGFYDVRVRHHELVAGSRLQVAGSQPANEIPKPATSNAQPATVQHLARIEVGPAEMGRLLQDDAASRVASALKKIGYAHVTLDLQGYRRGSANEGMTKAP